ncbi:hypothetical protein PVK06_017623 [Gossypium arboreum]|uniref:Uncharacterized protein n=1 Tax=Gossypium arboreum TaxID=29729 RepID=A0ABR0Q3Y4_GOSAR|nr:hypothetical protein PVK06_017623 [Gossypium arboreum]
MHCSSRRQTSMSKENEPIESIEEPTGRITRARAKVQRGAEGMCSSKPSFKQDQKCVLRMNSKCASSDENRTCVAATVGLQPKRRAVLKDVTNVSANGMQIDCLNVTEIQKRRATAKGCRRDAEETTANNDE